MRLSVGQKIGRLTIRSLAIEKRAGRPRRIAYVRCDCGTTKEIRADGVASGAVLSCGCFRIERVIAAATTHRGTGTPEYWVWHAMCERCGNPNAREFRNYGARGIAVCDRWQSFENFIGDMGRRPEGGTLERVDNSRGYEPGNCVWATMTEQNANKRNNRHIEFDGQRYIAVTACEKAGVRLSSMYRRAKRRGITHQQAFDDLRLGLWDNSRPFSNL